MLGLIFLKYISESFEELYNKLASGEGEYEGADPEDKDEYRAESVFYVPKTPVGIIYSLARNRRQLERI